MDNSKLYPVHGKFYGFAFLGKINAQCEEYPAIKWPQYNFYSLIFCQTPEILVNKIMYDRIMKC